MHWPDDPNQILKHSKKTMKSRKKSNISVDRWLVKQLWISLKFAKISLKNFDRSSDVFSTKKRVWNTFAYLCETCVVCIPFSACQRATARLRSINAYHLIRGVTSHCLSNRTMTTNQEKAAPKAYTVFFHVHRSPWEVSRGLNKFGWKFLMIKIKNIYLYENNFKII